jgi:nitrite reductase/ring-hydroxylating ferredoxin subunit/uncharacterized membrane protein
MRTWQPLERLIERIEGADALDGVADWVHNVAGKLIKPGPVEDTLSGTPSGHPLHPPLVAVPIGAWASVPILDLAGEDTAARRMTGFGCLAALPAAAAGANDWLYVADAERRLGLVHAMLNDLALSSYACSWWARRRGHRAVGVSASLAGVLFLVAAGYLGGHLAYAQGVGVDTTAFMQLPTGWTDAGPESELPADGAITSVTVEAIPVLVARRGERVVAMVDRCTHRGGQLSEGSVENGCVVCPLHSSTFSLDDGSVRSGPAVRPQPLFETRVRDGRLQIRRPEHRALRRNPVGR